MVLFTYHIANISNLRIILDNNRMRKLSNAGYIRLHNSEWFNLERINASISGSVVMLLKKK